MAEYEENIYGNQEIIRRHEGGSRPTKVIRPDGLGQESPVNFQEGFVYMNCEATQVGQYPVLKKGEEKSYPATDDHYEVFESQNKGASRTSGFPNANRNQMKSYEENISKGSTSVEVRPDKQSTTKAYVQHESIELQEKNSQDPVNMAPPKGNEKRENKGVSSYCLAAIAIVLSLLACTVALLFGFNVIKGADKCDCPKVSIGLQTQIDNLKQEIYRLRMNVSQLSSRSVDYMPSISSTAIPPRQDKSTSVTSIVGLAWLSSTVDSTGITATPSRNFASPSFSTALSVSNSSAMVHTTAVI